MADLTEIYTFKEVAITQIKQGSYAGNIVKAGFRGSINK